MVFQEGDCKTCKTRFRFPSCYSTVEYCTALCRVLSQQPTSGAEWKGTNTRQNKRRRKAYEHGDKIDPYVVYRHYDWICQLCGEDIDPELRLPAQMSATLDHIVPLCFGGTHTWDNVQPAHALCNFLKANML